MIRAWAKGESSSKISVYRTLHRVLTVTSRVLAPFLPFACEELWQNLVRGPFPDPAPGCEESVHLADYPEPDEAAIDLLMALIEQRDVASSVDVDVVETLGEIVTLTVSGSPLPLASM